MSGLGDSEYRNGMDVRSFAELRLERGFEPLQVDHIMGRGQAHYLDESSPGLPPTPHRCLPVYLPPSTCRSLTHRVRLQFKLTILEVANY